MNLPPLLLLTLFRDICWTVYAGVMIAFAINSMKTQIANEFLSTFRAVGVVLGLSLGGTVLSSIALYWFARGSYYPTSDLEAIGWGVGFIMWVSNIILEIWTLDPIRKDAIGILPAELKIEPLETKALLHIRLQALLCIGTYILCWFAEHH